MKRIIAIGVLALASVNFVFADSQVGLQLENYKVIGTSQRTDKALEESVTRNELFTWLNQLTAKLSAEKSKVVFKDIVPNSTFDKTAKRMGGLGLLLPDQESGSFKPTSKITYEDATYLLLHLMGNKTTYSDALQKAYETGILKDIRINRVNEVVTKKTMYIMIENSLKLKAQPSNESLMSILKLEEASVKGQIENLSGNAPIVVDPNAKVTRVESYGNNELIVHFSGVPGQGVLNQIAVFDAHGRSLKIASQVPLLSDTYALKFEESLVINATYEIKGTNSFKFVFDSMNQPRLYCINEMSKVTHTNQLKIRFNNMMSADSALDLRNYQSKDGLELKSIRFDVDIEGVTDLRTVLIETSDQVPGKTYRIVVQDGLKDIKGNAIVNLPNLRIINFYGSSYDISAPKVSMVLVKDTNELQVEFVEASGIDFTEAEKVTSYKIYDVETGKPYKIESARVLKNEVTGVYSTIKLKTESLDRLKRYIVEVNSIKDVQNNVISILTDFKGSFALTSEEEKRPQLVNVDPVSKNLLKLTFNRAVKLPKEFSLENIDLNVNVKPVSIEVDTKTPNVVWLKTTDHNQAGVFFVRIENIYDYFGNSTTKSETSRHYSANLGELSRPQLNLLENGANYGNHILELTFTQPMLKSSVENLDNYRIEGLEILYAYQTTNQKVKLVTSSQKKDLVYYLHIHGLQDQMGADIDTASWRTPFIGKDLN